MTRPSTATTITATLPVPQQTNPKPADTAAPDDLSSAAAAADAPPKAPARAATTPPRSTIKLKRLSAARYP